MYERVGTPQSAQRCPEPAGAAARGSAGGAVDRVRKLLTGYLPGMACDTARLRAALAGPLPGREGERLFALGWLHWLAGDFAGGEPVLAQALGRGGGGGAGVPPP